MTNIDREIINEDLEFIHEYLITLLERHPELANTDEDIFRKIDRRMNDIDKRLGA
jgi:hypothetical protein